MLALYSLPTNVSRGGLTNSISLGDLRKWATNTIELYQKRESVLPNGNGTRNQYSSVLAADVPIGVTSIQTHIPSCRSSKGLKFEGWEEYLEKYSKVWAVSKEEAERRLITITPESKPPKVGFFRSSAGVIEAVTINWYIYGVTVGTESFNTGSNYNPWYHRKLADGVYLWHGYK